MNSLDRKGATGVWGIIGIFLLGFVVGSALMLQPEVRDSANKIGQGIGEMITGLWSGSSTTIQKLVNDPVNYDGEEVTVEGMLETDESDNVSLWEGEEYVDILNFENAEKDPEITGNYENMVEVTGVFHVPRSIEAERIETA